MDTKLKTDLIINSERIAKRLSPIDTGNLRFNAIKSRRIYNGFQIYYDLSVAYYTLFLQYGTKYSTKWLGFIFPTTQNAIVGYCISQKQRFALGEDIEQQNRVIDTIKKNANTGDTKALREMSQRQTYILRSKYINGEINSVEEMSNAQSQSVNELTGLKQKSLDKYTSYFDVLKSSKDYIRSGERVVNINEKL